MTTAWANLPNAAHIDWVLADVARRPQVWDAARAAAWDAARAAARDAAWDAAWDAARDAARAAAWDAARAAARDAAWDAAWAATWAAAWAAAWDAAWGAIGALIAWDDVGPVMDMPPEQVHVLAQMGMHAPVLLLPAVIALNQTKGNKTPRNT